MTKCIPAVLSVLVILSWVTDPVDALASGPSIGTWTTRSPAPTKRTEVAVAAVQGKIYVAGGFSQPGFGNFLDYAISRTVEVYDPATDSWTSTTPLPEGRHHAGMASLDGYLYLIGGFTRSFLSVWRAVDSVYRYDPSTSEWSALKPMPTARGGLAVAVYQHRLYAIGGYDGKKNPAVVEVFDPQTNSWASVAPLPTPRDHLAAATVGSKIYAIGGRPKLNYRKNMAVVEEYDPASDQWRTRTSLPTARSGITAGVIEGEIYVLGESPKAGRSRITKPMRLNTIVGAPWPRCRLPGTGWGRPWLGGSCMRSAAGQPLGGRSVMRTKCLFFQDPQRLLRLGVLRLHTLGQSWPCWRRLTKPMCYLLNPRLKRIN